MRVVLRYRSQRPRARTVAKSDHLGPPRALERKNRALRERDFTQQQLQQGFGDFVAARTAQTVQQTPDIGKRHLA